MPQRTHHATAESTDELKMTENIRAILIVLAVVLFLLAGVNVPQPPRVSLGWLGLAALAIAVWLR
jgi:hypothetical protein